MVAKPKEWKKRLDMKIIELEFLGYTWEEYFYVIAEKSGILVTYMGSLDSEGAIKLEEILCVSEADRFSDILDTLSCKFNKERLDNKRLFFSFAEIEKTSRTVLAEALNDIIFSKTFGNKSFSDVKIVCKGACALFPKELLQTI